MEYCSPDRNGDTALSLLDEGTTRSLEDRMAIFDQRGQKVNYQYNAAGDISFDAIRHAEEFLQELRKLRLELDRAVEASALDRKTAIEVLCRLDKALLEAQDPRPSRKAIEKYLAEAKSLIEGLASAAGLVVGLVQAADVVKRIFP